MHTALIIMALIGLLAVTLEDFLLREIRLLWFISAAITGLLLTILNDSWEQITEGYILLLITTGLLALYILLRFGTRKQVFGYGDWLILALLPLYLKPNLILPTIVLASGIAAIISILRKEEARIPYAGYLGVACMIGITLQFTDIL